MSQVSPPYRHRPGPDDIVELRVHGVSGAGPERVLERGNLRQVAGDRRAGFHRPAPDATDGTGPGGTVLEAYRWSDLPSGTMARTLSLVLLLPFMLSNLAMWMRPVGRRTGPGVTVLCRLLALNLTLLYVLSVAGVALDLLAWRCLGGAHCSAWAGWAGWLDGRSAGQRLAVLALVPVAAVVFLRLLGNPTAPPGRHHTLGQSSHWWYGCGRSTSPPRSARSTWCCSPRVTPAAGRSPRPCCSRSPRRCCSAAPACSAPPGCWTGRRPRRRPTGPPRRYARWRTA